LLSANLFGQDTTATETFDMSQYEEATTTQKKYCTQKVLNQTPTKLIGVGYEHNFGFENSNDQDGTVKFGSLGGLRLNTTTLAVSKNNLILTFGLSTWISKFREVSRNRGVSSMDQIYANRLNLGSFSTTLFKPLNEKRFVTAQANIDLSNVGVNNKGSFTSQGLTFYGLFMYGWKKDDYKMFALGLSRTYRLGRPLIVPVILYNKTFNEKWGVETLFPARAHVRYNFSTNSMLLAGYELEGQQYDLVNSNLYLQRGEIKPRIVLEKKVAGFIWLTAQAGYRVNGRFNLVNKYNGGEKNEVLKNNFGNAPFFNIGFNFVSP
jgi:hypothetical protein